MALASGNKVQARNKSQFLSPVVQTPLLFSTLIEHDIGIKVPYIIKRCHLDPAIFKHGAYQGL